MTPRQELEKLRALASQQPAILSPRQELEQLRALATKGEESGFRRDSSATGRGSLGGIRRRIEPEPTTPQDTYADIYGADVPAPTPRGEEYVGSKYVEPALTVGTSILAEPAAGLAGIGGMIGAKTPEEVPQAGAEGVEQAREALTYQPRTEAGQKSLQALSNALAPIGETLQKAEKFLGDETFQTTNSPALAAAATTIPTILLEALGLAAAKGGARVTKKIRAATEPKRIKKAIVESAPEIAEIENVSRAVYRELDGSGVRVKEYAFKNLVEKIKRDVKRQGFDPDITPKTAAVLRRLESEVGDQSLTEIDILRQVAKKAARATESADASLGNVIIDNIDEFLDHTSPSSFQQGNLTPAEIGPKYKVARELWGRTKRAQLIRDAIEKAKFQATGFENGIRTQLRSILTNKKQRRFFEPEELKAMAGVEQGTTGANLAKLIGKFGFSDTQAANMLGGAIGLGFGQFVGGTPGAVAVAGIGYASKKLAQRLTANNARFAQKVIAAGVNADEIAKAYWASVPRAQRSAQELSELLLRKNISLEEMLLSSNRLSREAAEIAQGMRGIQAAIALGTPGAIKEQAEK